MVMEKVFFLNLYRGGFVVHINKNGANSKVKPEKKE